MLLKNVLKGGLVRSGKPKIANKRMEIKCEDILVMDQKLLDQKI
jgi:hypothetical protein